MDNKIRQSVYNRIDHIIQAMCENLEVTLYCATNCLKSEDLIKNQLSPQESECLSRISRNMCY